MRFDGEGDKKQAILNFKNKKETKKAYLNLKEIQSKLTFNSNIKIELDTLDSSLLPSFDDQLNEYDKKATRTLYIGNLDRDVTQQDLRELLIRRKYDDIIDIEIKKDPNKPHTQNSYAFIQFRSIKTVLKAIHCLESKYFGSNLVKLGFGKSKPTRCLWIDNLNENLFLNLNNNNNKSNKHIFMKYFSQVKYVLINRLNRTQVLLFFDSIDSARLCADKIRGLKLFNNDRIMVDFATNKESSNLNHDYEELNIDLNDNNNDLIDSNNLNDIISFKSRSNSINRSQSCSSVRSSSTQSSYSINSIDSLNKLKHKKKDKHKNKKCK